MSRWLVGSSSTRKFGGSYSIAARTRRAFSPPDRMRHDFSTSSPEKPKAPASERIEPMVASGNEAWSDSSTDFSASSSSIACCAKYPSFTLAPSTTFPSSAVDSPATSFSSVDLPAPLTPMTHHLSLRRTSRSSPS